MPASPATLARRTFEHDWHEGAWSESRFGTDGTLTARGADYMGKFDALTGVRRSRLRDRKWAAAEGVLYDGWDDAVNLVERFPVPDSWTRWWTVDFGFRHTFVLQCWAEDPDGQLVRYLEIFHTRRLVEDHATTILPVVTEPVPDTEQRPDDESDAESIRRAVQEGRRRWIEPRPRGLVCDHDAEGRATLEKHLGMSTIAANKKVTEGIQAVQARLKEAGDGRPRLMLMRDSVVERDQELEQASRPCSTEEEIPGYVWAIKPGGQLKEEPVKAQDDGCDAPVHGCPA